MSLWRSWDSSPKILAPKPTSWPLIVILFSGWEGLDLNILGTEKESRWGSPSILAISTNPVDVEPLAALVCIGPMECGAALPGIGVSSFWIPTLLCPAIGGSDAALSVCDLR